MDFFCAFGAEPVRLALAHKSNNDTARVVHSDERSFIKLDQSSIRYSVHDNTHLIVIGKPLIEVAAQWTPPSDDALLAHLEDERRELSENSSAELSRSGSLKGCFSLIAFDQSSSKVTLLTDRFNHYPVFFSQSDGNLILAAQPKAIRDLQPAAHPVSHDAIFQYIYFHMIPSATSIFTGIEKTRPSSCYQTDGNNWSRQPRLSTRFVGSDTSLPHDAKAHLGEIIDASVARMASDGDDQVAGAFLSGGLDSSTVAGYLAKNHPSNAKTFSMGFSEEGYDETEYARLTAKHFSTDHHELYITPEMVLEGLPKIVSAMAEPFGNSSALPAYFCAKFARENGVSRLLAGDGGDELFAGNTRYLKQQTFDHYQKVPGVLRKYLLEPLFGTNGLLSKLPPAKKIASYIEQAKCPLPDRLQRYNFLVMNPSQKVFRADFLAQVDQDRPIAMLRERYRAAEADNDLDRMLYLDWKFTLADNDLVKVNQMCQLAGVEVEYPLLSDEITEFSMTIPAAEKIKHKDLRHFFKESVKDFLHPDTLTKSKHGFGLPFGLWMRDNQALNEFTHRHIAKLRDRGIFNDDFIDETITKHQNEHAGFYGELLWLMLVLELWLSDNGC